jgi:hypothetical protein
LPALRSGCDLTCFIILFTRWFGWRRRSPWWRCFESFRDDQLAWAHLNADHLDTFAGLRREVGYLNDFVVNALYANEARSRISPVGDGVLLILRRVNPNENTFFVIVTFSGL